MPTIGVSPTPALSRMTGRGSVRSRVKSPVGGDGQDRPFLDLFVTV
ncbi:hypothetical protein [Cohnella sp. REN36]|nr:hypothetical protein [Cohnella sp. REN36]MCC3374701.1 hypothetical protein [Cohnella sp. REN36]